MPRATIFNPHPDDAEIGMGGSIIKLVNNGWKVEFVYMTDGSRGSDTIPPSELIEIRTKEAREARKLLGVREAHSFGVEDGGLPRIRADEKREIKKQISGLLRETDAVFIPSRAEAHPDHVVTHDIVWDVISKGRKKIVVGKYLVWLFPDFYRKRSDLTNLIYLVDITDEIEKKMKAVRCHDSQVRQIRCDEMAKRMNGYFSLIFRASGCAEILGIFNRNETEKKLFVDLGRPHNIARVRESWWQAVEK
jgi:LmbE family N-acetylglucosaminyl deacetylase